MKNIVFYIFLGLMCSSFLFASEELPKFLQEMPHEEVKKWNRLHYALDDACFAKDALKALKICKQIYSMHQTYGEIAYADTYHMMGDDRKAIEWAEKAIESARKYNLPIETAMTIIVSSHFLLGEYDKGLQVSDEIIAKYPQSPSGYQSYAEYHERMGNFKEAIYYWSEAKKRFNDGEAIREIENKLKILSTKLRNDIFSSQILKS